MRIVGNDPTLSRQITATASGAISAAGKPLIVNTDGTVSDAAIINESLSSASTYGAISTAPVMAVDTTNNRIVIAGRDADYGTGKAIVGTIDTSNDTVSFGSFAQFEDGSNTENFAVAFDSSNSKVVIVYSDGADSNNGKAVVGTVSGKSISYGTIVQFDTNARLASVAFDSNAGKIVIAYADYGNSGYGTAIVGTVSGTDISFGTAQVFKSASSTHIDIAFDSSNNKVVVAYVATHHYGIVGTVSGTSISFGSEAKFADNGGSYNKLAFDSSNNKFLIIYKDQATDDGFGIVGTVSGTSISYGSAVEFHDANTSEMDLAFDTDVNKFLIAYKDDGDSDKGKYVTASISGTTPSFGAEAVLDSGRALQPNVEYDSGNKRTVINYRDTSGVGTIKLWTHQQEKLTTENFIGTSAHVAADGAKVLVNTQGAIDENQSGLTAGQTFFVDKNGALRLSTTVAASVGASVNVTSGGTLGEHPAITYDSNSNRYVAVFSDDGNSGYGTAVVVSVSGTTCSVGSSVVFSGSSKGTDISIAFDSNANKVLIAYRDQGNSNYGTAVVGTVDNSDNSISFGTPAVFESATAQYMGMDFDSNANKFVIAYRDGGNSGHGTAVVATISGTNVSFGTPVVFNAASNFTDPTPVTFDSSNNKVLISYRDSGNSNYGTSIVGTVSGTAISFGTEAVFESANSSVIGSAFDSSNNKVVIGYRDAGNSGHGTAVVATISSTSVSFGTPVVFNAAGIQYPDLAFSTQLNKVFIVYQDNETVVNGILGTVSGTSISFGSEISLSGASSGSSDSGERTELGVAFNTTDNNFVIISMPKDGSSATQVFAHTSEEDLSGSLSTDAVTAGTALSATKLLVKG